MFKKISYCFLLFILWSSLVFAKDKKEFDSYLKDCDYKILNYTNEKTYKDWSFVDKKTKQKKEFKTFNELQKFIFYLFQGNILENDLENLQNKWEAELKIAEENPLNEKMANKEDIINYLGKLKILRKKNAIKLEYLTQELFERWPNEFTKEEKEYISKTLKNHHDKQKLIERE